MNIRAAWINEWVFKDRFECTIIIEEYYQSDKRQSLKSLKSPYVQCI